MTSAGGGGGGGAMLSITITINNISIDFLGRMGVGVGGVKCSNFSEVVYVWYLMMLRVRS